MDNTLQINKLKRMVGQLEIQMGMKMIGDAVSDFTSRQSDFNEFSKTLSVLAVPVTQFDTSYYFTSWDNWLKIIETINPIIQAIPWVMDKADCDKRSFFIIGMIAELFEINTIRPLYCDVYKVSDGKYAYTHYCEVIADDAGNAYIYDQDNAGGLYTKITSPIPIMGNCKYVPRGVK